MSNPTTLSLTPAATALVKFVKGEITADLKRESVYAAYVVGQDVTPENLGTHVAMLTEAAYPDVKPSSRADAASREGRAHNFRNKVRNGLKRALDIAPPAKAPALRVSLSGEGGGSTVVEDTHPLYAALVALVTGEAEATLAA